MKTGLSLWFDYQSNWFKKLSKETNHPITPHRKQWEFFSLLHVLEELNLIQEGKKGLVFGVGTEWTVSYLAGKGCEILATDLEEDNPKVANWNTSGLHCAAKEQLKYSNFISDKLFEDLVSFRPVNMNNIPSDIEGYDFCWSLCALEHLGSVENSFKFIEKSVECLKPGGWAYHTTEYAIDPSKELYETIDNVFFRKQEIENKLVPQIESRGWYIAPRDYSLGDSIEDYPLRSESGREASRSLKIYAGGEHLITSIGLLIQRREEHV